MKLFRRRARRRAFGLIKFLCLIAVVAAVVAAVWIIAPQLFRVQGVQTPVSVKVRDALFGSGNVVQVRNESEKTLEEIVVTALDPASNQRARYTIDSLGPGKTKDIGWMEWSWNVKPGERIQVDAKGYLPIAFSAKQLGIK